MCDEWTELDRGETPSLKKKGKRGFSCKESQIYSGKMLRPKTNEKLGFPGEER